MRGDSYARPNQARTSEATYMDAEANRKSATIAEPEVEEHETVPEPVQAEMPQAEQVPATACPEMQQPTATSLLKPPETRPPEINDDVLTYEVSLEKMSGGLGIDLSPHDGRSLLVGRVKEGGVAVWNASRPPGSADIVMRGDRIVVVNGTEGSAEDLLAKMRSDTMLVLRFRRCLFLAVRVRRTAGDVLGLVWEQRHGSAVITDVQGASATEKANRKHGAERELRSGDRIVEVNGERDVAKFDALMNAGCDLHLKVRRPAGELKEP